MSSRGTSKGAAEAGPPGDAQPIRSAAPASTRPSAPVVGEPRVAAARICVLRSPDADAAGRMVMLSCAPVAVGRAPHARGPLALDDPELSRDHAAIEPDGDGGAFRVADRGSRNGVFVDGARVERARLEDGAVVRVGATLLLHERIALRRDDRLDAEEGVLLGQSVAIQRVRAEIARVAPRSIHVLVLGESGAGKELVARDLHRRSGRAGPFVPVNCGGLPEALVEGELFGHVAGAFTGADRARPGLFVAARGGTIFLDEIGELPLPVQPKLLRALAAGEVRPVGGVEPVKVDARVVAATNRVDLEGAVAEGRLRGDVYARLAGWTIVVPPLRERRADVLLLAAHFLAAAGAPPAIDTDVAEALLVHRWPYNVRELEQVTAQAAVRAEGAASLSLRHLPPSFGARLSGRTASLPPEAPPPLELLVARTATPGREALALVLERLEGNVAKVAEYFGKERRQVYRWAERHGLDPDAFRPPDAAGRE